MSQKKGLGMWNFPVAKAQDVGATWAYNWNTNGQDTENVGYVPMIWGNRNNTNGDYERCKEAGSPFILGMNEPDSQTGGDEAEPLTPEYCAQVLWPRLKWTGKKLGSPAVSSSLDWLRQFMLLAGADVDFMCVHHYPNLSDTQRAVQETLDLCQLVAATYQRPVWLTEFGSLGGDSEINVINFIQTLCPLLETTTYIEKYAWFSDYAYRGSDSSAIFDENGQLTNVGRAYAGI